MDYQPYFSIHSPTHSYLLRRALAWSIFLILPLSIAAQGTGNLIQNGNFQDGPSGWNVNAFQPESIQFVNDEGNIYALLNQDPQGQDFNNPFRFLDQSMPGAPITPEVPGFGFTANIALAPGSEVVLNAIRFEIHLFLLTSFIIEHIPFANLDIPRDGNFHPVQGYLPLPAGYLTDNEVQQIYFAITKFASGAICIDDINIFAGPPPVNVDANLVGDSGPLRGGTEVRIMGEGVGEFPFVHFGNRGAPIINRGPNELTVLSPPAIVPGPVDVSLINGQEVLVNDPFTYLPPPNINGVEPRFLGPSSPDTLIIRGNNFHPGNDILIGDQMIPPENVTVDIEIVSLDLTSVQPIEVGFHDVQIRDNGGGIFTSPFPIQVKEPPVINEIHPSHGSIFGGDFIEIHGANLDQCGLEVMIGGHPLAGFEQKSETLICGFTPPNPPGPTAVLLNVGNDPVPSPPGTFNFLESPPGDYDGDGYTTLADWKAWQSIYQNPDAPVPNPSGDVNGDGVVDFAELHGSLLDVANPHHVRFSDAPPTLNIEYCNPDFSHVRVNDEFHVNVQNLGFSAPGMIDWGDGFVSNIQQDGAYPHAYDNPGTFTVSLITDNGPADSETVTVVPENPVSISSIDLSLSGMDIDNNPIEGRNAQLNTENEPPELMATIHATGSGMVHGTVHFDSDQENADVFLPFSAEIPAEPAGEKTVEVNLGPAVVSPGEAHIVSVEVNTGAELTPEATAPMPATVQIPAFVTTGDCEEIERMWKALVAQKQAKKADCEALEKQLQKCKDDLAEKEADKPNKEQDLQDCKDQKDELQSEIDDIINDMNAFLGPNANVQTYMDSGDFPPGTNHVGSKRNGSSTGVGMSFGNANEALSDIENYEGATGRDFGADMAKMRQNIKDIENLDQQIMDKEQELEDLNDEIDDLKNNKIPNKEQMLADCKAMCDSLETQIQSYAEAHAECLEQLEAQRKAQAGINDTERQGTRVQNQADRTGNNADNAEELVGSRAGSPSQVANDESEIATAKSCQEQAQSLINEGKQLLRQARSALAGGDPAMADSLRMQAQTKFDQAKAKLDEAQTHINTASSNARGRKRRDCPEECEGLERITEEKFEVFTHLEDVSLVWQGYTPEKWASVNEAAREAIDGLALVSDLNDAAGGFSPIAGATAPDVGEVANAILDAFLDLGARAGWDVWIKERGRCMIKRTVMRCVNGCWELDRIETEYVGEEIVRDRKLGTLEVPLNQRESALRSLLQRYYRSNHKFRKGPPTTSKPQ